MVHAFHNTDLDCFLVGTRVGLFFVSLWISMMVKMEHSFVSNETIQRDNRRWVRIMDNDDSFKDEL